MEMDLSNQEKKGFLGGVCGKVKDKVINVGMEMKQIAKNDPRKIIHSAKVGLALTLVSLLYYVRPLYNGFGQSGMWAILTVVVVFEFSVGGTLYKSLNRGVATMTAAALGLGVQYLAELCTGEWEPIILGSCVFILAMISTFIRFHPKIKKKYDYGVLIFILTFSLVAVSGYRINEILELELSEQRISTILIGVSTCMVISIFIFPVWSGQELHNLITNNLEKLSSFLEYFGDECFNSSASINDKRKFQSYKSILDSKASEESAKNLAWWEPPHGNFRYRHPWNQYSKVGGLIRQCAYHFHELSGYINTNLEAPTEFIRLIQEPCKKMSLESSKVFKELASAMMKMKHPSGVEIHLKNSKAAIDDIKAILASTSLENTDLLKIIPAVTLASILIDTIECVETILESINELSTLAQFKMSKSAVSPEIRQEQLLHRGIVQPINEYSDGDAQVMILINQPSQDSEIQNSQTANK